MGNLSITTTIFLFVVCLSGGIIIGAMFSRVQKVHPKQEEGKDLPESPPPEKSLALPGEMELLRAWQDKDGQTWLEMDGERLESKKDLNPEQKKKVLKMVMDLRPWLEVPPSPAPAAAPQPAETPMRRSLYTPQPVRTEVKPTVELEKPKVNLNSIVAQIDDVLQKKLAGTSYETQKVHLLEGPGGEVMVQVGAQKFGGIGDVPSAEIQALIRQAVTEWEKSSR